MKFLVSLTSTLCFSHISAAGTPQRRKLQPSPSLRLYHTRTLLQARSSRDLPGHGVCQSTGLRALRTHLWPVAPRGAASCPSQASVSDPQAWFHAWEPEALRRICCCYQLPDVCLHRAGPAPQPPAPSAPLPSPVPAAMETEIM